MKRYENHISFHEYKEVEIVSGTCIHSFPIHIHKALCIGIITNGYANFIMNSHETVLSAGDYYIIPPYIPHSLSAVKNKEFSYTVYCIKDFHIQQNRNEMIVSAKDYIERAAKDFNIDVLSQTMHISKYHLNRKFKEQLGITPYQFYINARVKKIRQGLNAQVSLSDLVYDLGFSDQSHLCNTFKKHMGISPLQYASSYYRC